MTDQIPPAIGTVAQEAARLIEEMATMARSGYNRTEGPRAYAGAPAQEPKSSGTPHPQSTEPEPASCSMCGAERDGTDGYESYDGYENSDPAGQNDSSSPGGADHMRDGREVPTTCRLCPLCKGIELFRAVRPETVDLLADPALSLASSLRDVAKRSRDSDHRSSTSSTSGGTEQGPTVQDIFVDDETEG